MSTHYLKEGDNLTVFNVDEDRIVLVDDDAHKYEILLDESDETHDSKTVSNGIGDWRPPVGGKHEILLDESPAVSFHERIFRANLANPRAELAKELCNEGMTEEELITALKAPELADLDRLVELSLLNNLRDAYAKRRVQGDEGRH